MMATSAPAAPATVDPIAVAVVVAAATVPPQYPKNAYFLIIFFDYLFDR